MKPSIRAGLGCAASVCLTAFMIMAGCGSPGGGGAPSSDSAQIENNAGAAVQKPPLAGYQYDWSHRHLIFSRPRTEAAARRIRQDPRYRIQQAWRARQARAGSTDAYMQSLDALAQQLAAARTLPVLPPLKWGLPAPGIKKIPVGAWGESLNTIINNPNGNSTYPAKFSFTSSASCSDWVAFTLPIPGSPSQFNIFAFKNLYTATCGGPTLKFTYDLSASGGPLVGSPVISALGDQLAFIEGSPTATLHVLKYADLTASPTPTFPNPMPTAILPTCGTAPCRKSVTYSGAATSLSAPFYDYTTGQDTAYVTDDNSTVWAISSVFGGTPQIKTGWRNGISVNINTALKLTAPVYDSTSQNVFFADSSGNLYYVRTTNTAAGTCKGSASGAPCLGDTPATLACTGNGTPQACCTGLKTGCNGLKVSSTNRPIIEPVIVDSSTEKVFVFSNGNPNTNSGSSVVQTDVTLSVLNVASIGAGSSNVIHSGAFDNNYFTNPVTGHLYVCGQDAGNIPQLYAFGFTNSPTNGTMTTTPVTGSPIQLATAAAKCSPLTENYDGTTDRLFVSVTAGCPASGSSSSGCVESFNITSGFPSLTTPPYSINYSQSSVLGTSSGAAGIIIDNTTGTANQMNMYFETQNAGSACAAYSGGTISGDSCAVSLTQSSLN